MPKPPIDMTRHPEYQRRQRERQAARQRQSEQDAEMGRQAFQALQEHFGKLSTKDREAIAQNLYWEVEDFYATHPDEERYLLLKDAGLTDENSTKVLPRLVMKPGEPSRTKEGLYASPEKYRWLIETLVRRSGDSLDALASRVFVGTTFYPQLPDSPTPDMREPHLILAALKAAVNRVDAEFQLLAQCREVDLIRQQREAPYWQYLRETNELPEDQTWHEVDDELWWPLQDGSIVTGCMWKHADDPENFWVHYPLNSFWSGPVDFHSTQGLCGADYSTEGVCRVDFFFFPHVYLGPAENWAGERDPGIYDWVQEHLPSSEEPRVCWEESIQRYVLRQSEHVLPDGTTTTEYEQDEGMFESARWLVIYPDPLLQKLVPAIFTLGTMCGGSLSPLTVRMVADLGDANRWEYFGKDAPTLLQRLKDLTGFRTGEFKVYDAWRETAARFHLNPILRRHPEVIEELRYRKHLERWISQDRVGTREDDRED